MFCIKRVVYYGLLTPPRPVPLPYSRRGGTAATATGSIYSHPTTVCQLKNRIKVVTEETGSPVTTMGMFFEAGPKFETSQTNGVTYFFEHLAYKSFTNLCKGDFERYVESMGIKMKAHTTRDQLGFYTTCLLQDVHAVANIFFDVLFNCELNFDEMREEKFTICQELCDDDMDPKKLVFEYLHQTAYQGTPLGLTMAGPTKNIGNFRKKDVLTYMCEQFQPWRMVMASSGGLSHDAHLNCVESKFGTYLYNPCITPCAKPNRYTGSSIIFRNDNLPFGHVAVAVEAPGYPSSDYVPMLVASSIVGSWHRSQVRGDLPATSVGRAIGGMDDAECSESFYIAYKDTGLWGVYFVAGATGVEDTLFNIQSQWMSLCSTVTGADVERGVNATKTKLARRFSSQELSCRDLAMQAAYIGCRRSMTDYCRMLAQVTVASVRAAAGRYIYDKCPAVAAVGATEAMPDYTRVRGGMYWLRL